MKMLARTGLSVSADQKLLRDGPAVLQKNATAGFKTVLERVAKVWRNNRDQVLEQGADTMRQLQEFTASQGARCKEG